MKTKHKTIPIFVPHWGCPQDCSFCDQKKITGMKEEMTAEKAAEIIAVGTRNRRPEDHIEIGFFGGSFTGIPAKQQEDLLKLAQEAVLAGKADAIRLSTRPDYINDAVLERLLRFGVKTVELGAQSMDDLILSLSRRGHTAEQTISAGKKIKEAGLSLGLQMMIGLPGDTEEKTRKTAEAFVAMKPQCVRMYPTLVIDGTTLCKQFQAGEYEPLSLEDAVKRCTMLYRIFTRENIEIIRMSLLDMEQDAVVAGPYHPAFGELVMSRVYYEDLSRKLSGFQGDKLNLRVNPGDVSAIVGQRKENIIRLKQEFNLKDIKMIQDRSLSRGEILVF